MRVLGSDPAAIRLGSGVFLQDNTYAWRSDGILRSRVASSGASARTEAFGYDLLNRMTSAPRLSPGHLRSGTIAERSRLGSSQSPSATSRTL